MDFWLMTSERFDSIRGWKHVAGAARSEQGQKEEVVSP